MSNDKLQEIRERMLRYRGVKYSFVKGMRYAHDVEILLGELADSSAEIDRLNAENASLKQQLDEANERLGAAVEDMNAMALAMRESDELSEGCSVDTKAAQGHV